MLHPDEATISVLKDGETGWVCEVEWGDGQVVTKELEFFMAAYPEVVITTEDQALECLERSVRDNPAAWRSR